jgi:hypothetical protein
VQEKSFFDLFYWIMCSYHTITLILKLNTTGMSTLKKMVKLELCNLKIEFLALNTSFNKVLLWWEMKITFSI